MKKSNNNNKETATVTTSKRIASKIARVNAFNNEEATAWERLLTTSAKAEIETFSRSKALKTFIEAGKGILTASQLKALEFKAVNEFINASKYKDLPTLTFHQITLLCNGYLKTNHAPTKIAAKVAKQGGAIKQKAA